MHREAIPTGSRASFNTSQPLPAAAYFGRQNQAAARGQSIPPLWYTLPYMDKNTKDILETLTFIKDRMATKEDVRDIIREEVPPIIEAAIHKTVPPMIEEALRPIYRELHAIRDDLEELRHRVKDMAGYRKEIDYAFERIAAIEKHLGIDRKQVA